MFSFAGKSGITEQVFVFIFLLDRVCWEEQTSERSPELLPLAGLQAGGISDRPAHREGLQCCCV